MTFWRRLTTSRYTVSLEERIEELKATIAQKDAEIARLNQALIPQLRQIAKEDQKAALTIAPRKTVNAKQDDAPKVGNWLHAREQLEVASDTRHEMYEPQAEKRRANSESEA